MKEIIQEFFRAQSSRGGDKFWDLETDTLHNFQFYFTNNNPRIFKNCQLKQENISASRSFWRKLNYTQWHKQDNVMEIHTHNHSSESEFHL